MRNVRNPSERNGSIEVVARLLNRHKGQATALLTGLVVVNLIVQQAWHWNRGLVRFELFFAVLTIAIPTLTALAIGWVRHLSGAVSHIAAFNDDSASFWIDQQLGNLLVRWAPLASGSLLLIIGVYSTITYWVGWQGWIEWLFLIWAGIFFFGYGTLIWAFGSLLVLVWRISNLPIACSPFAWPIYQINAVYRTYFYVLSTGALLYGLAVLSVWISPYGAQVALETYSGMAWVFPPAACLILFFLVVHFRLHVLLLRYKQASDDELTRLLEAEYNAWAGEPGAEREERIDKLLAWRDHVRKEDEWPLGLKTVLLTVTTLLIPTIKTVVEFATK
jgi:hypothetical protein